ncbi:serine/threonine-protein kinase bud32 [Dimargaris verticillata]|uniref:non-specific serine/threonine protein kinase n=1 Tax=Dimargaris verticillata TaxID=2761393 RepID=A0A9W8EFU2_9FUNG|nr:serine/threonine-protein kinase bud32 [Dimargaris verticillata]
MATLVQQGAEAKVYATSFYGRDAIVKERFPKTYRHPDLDKKLTHKRVVQEARCLARCQRAGIDVPALYNVDTYTNVIYMERIAGRTVKLCLLDPETDQAAAVQVATKIGESLAALHAIDIVHGDLTTSNLFLRDSNGSLAIIDFGLSYHSHMIEDKAVDLYVLERAFLSTHPDSQAIFDRILEVYLAHCKQAQKVFAKLEDVRLRGRKRSMVG